jgi:ribosomal protein L18E
MNRRKGATTMARKQKVQTSVNRLMTVLSEVAFFVDEEMADVARELNEKKQHAKLFHDKSERACGSDAEIAAESARCLIVIAKHFHKSARESLAHASTHLLRLQDAIRKCENEYRLPKGAHAGLASAALPG